MSGIRKDMHVIVKPGFAADFPTLKPNAVYLVIGVLPRNVRLDPLSGGLPFRIDPVVLQEATPAQVAKAQAAAADAPPRHRFGATVHWNTPVTGRRADEMRRLDLKLTHPLVVTKEHIDGSVDVTPLGGTERGIRWTKQPAQHLTAIPLDRIADFL